MANAKKSTTKKTSEAYKLITHGSSLTMPKAAKSLDYMRGLADQIASYADNEAQAQALLNAHAPKLAFLLKEVYKNYLKQNGIYRKYNINK